MTPHFSKSGITGLLLFAATDNVCFLCMMKVSA